MESITLPAMTQMMISYTKSSSPNQRYAWQVQTGTRARADQSLRNGGLGETQSTPATPAVMTIVIAVAVGIEGDGFRGPEVDWSMIPTTVGGTIVGGIRGRDRDHLWFEVGKIHSTFNSDSPTQIQGLYGSSWMGFHTWIFIEVFVEPCGRSFTVVNQFDDPSWWFGWKGFIVGLLASLIHRSQYA